MQLATQGQGLGFQERHRSRRRVIA